MSQNEKLGIEIVIDLSGAKKQLEDLNKILANAGKGFKAEDFAKSFASAFAKAFSNIEKQAAQSAEKISKIAKKLADANANGLTTGAEAQSAIKQSTFNKQMAAASKTIQDYSRLVLNADGVLVSFVKNQKELAAAAERAAKALVSQQRSQTKGFEYIDPADKNKGYSRSSVIKDQSIAFDQALIEKATRESSAANKALSDTNKAAAASARETARAELDRARAHREAARAAREAEKPTGILAVSLSKLTTRIAEFYTIRTALFAVTNQIREAVGASISLNQSMYDIAAIAGAPVDSVNVFSDAILTIAKNSRFTADEVSGLMKVLAQAGVKMEQLPAVSAAVGMFATATGSSPAVSADLTTTAMNVFGITAENVAKITNSMTAALNESKLSTEGLATAFNYLAPQAAQLGLSLEQTLGMIATQAQAGIKPSTIGTGLSQLLKDLAAPKPRLKKLLEVYGIDQDSIDTTKHTLDEVADVFKNHNVKVQDLMAAMDTRVGRAMITSITLGGDAFRLMTENVTGTNATMIAFDKSMQGAQARLNVIKQTFASTVVTLGQGGLGGALSAITDGITSFVRGLESAPGQIMLVATGVGTLVLAIKALSGSLALLGIAASVGQIGLLLGALTLLGAGVAAVGNHLHKEEDALKASNEALVKKRTVTGEYVKLLNRAAVENSAYNESMKEAARLYREEGELALPKIAKLKGQDITLTAELRTEIAKFAAKHPAYVELLNKEKISLTELYEIRVKLNKESQADDISRMNEANSINRNIATLQATLEALERQKANPSKGRTKRSVDDEFESEDSLIQRKIDKAKQTIQQLKVLRSETLKPVQMPYAADELNQVRPIFDKAKPEATKGPDMGGSSTAAESAADVLKRIKNREEKNREQLKQEALQQARLTGEAELQALQKAGEETKDKKLAVEKQLDDEFAARRKAERAAAFTQLADDFGGSAQLNADGSYGITGYDKKFKPGQVKAGLAEVARTQQQQELADLARYTKEKAEIAKMAEPKKPDLELPTLDAAKREKQLDLELRTTQQVASIKKEETYAASEIYKIEEETLHKTIEVGKQKVKNLESDNEEIEKWIELNEGKEEAKQKLEDLRRTHEQNVDRIKEQNLLLAAQASQYDRLADHSFWGNFKKGSGSAWASISDTDKLSQGLGSDLTNSAFSGITGTLSNTLSTFTMPDQDAIDGIKSKINELNVQKAQIQASISSITSKGEFMTGADKSALNEQASGLEAVNASLREQEKLLDKQNNAWSRFKDGLAETMKQILKTLQEYIIKLMVVKMVQSVVGLFAGGTAQTELNSPSGISQPAFSGGDADYFLPKATGGLIPTGAGVPGKDSVPILAMPGEFVIPTNSVNKYGVAFFEKLRAQKFAEGGLVGGNSRPMTTSGEKSVQNLQIVNIVDPSQIPQTTDDQIINVISYDMARKGQTYRAVRQVAAG